MRFSRAAYAALFVLLGVLALNMADVLAGVWCILDELDQLKHDARAYALLTRGAKESTPDGEVERRAV